MTVPVNPKIYHIVHMDRLKSIIDQSCLWCMTEAGERHLPGTSIGFTRVKDRRAKELFAVCHEGLLVGQCVPFNFCPRSVMLFVVQKGNHQDLEYRGGEVPVVHLEADLIAATKWAEANNRRWAITTSNAGERLCDFYCDLTHLDKINWDAVQTDDWAQVRGQKQSEFLIETSFPWELIERIGIHPRAPYRDIMNTMAHAKHRPPVESMKGWYYGS